VSVSTLWHAHVAAHVFWWNRWHGRAAASFIYGGYLGLCYLTQCWAATLPINFWATQLYFISGTTMGHRAMFLFFSASIFASIWGLATTLMWSALA
jgi:hypothetical protein